jgi:hypothetical protein
MLAALAAGVAGLAAATGDRLPDTQAACVKVPLVRSGGLQLGYCPD